MGPPKLEISPCCIAIRENSQTTFRGVINGKAGKAAALPKFSNTLTLSQWGEGADYAQPLALPHLIFFGITPLTLTRRGR